MGTSMLYTSRPILLHGSFHRAFVEGPEREVDTHAAIGELLRRWREIRGMTQEAVAAALRDRGETTATNTVQRWERTGRVQVGDAILLANLYGVTLSELLQVVDEPGPSGRPLAKQAGRGRRWAVSPASSPTGSREREAPRAVFESRNGQ